MQLSSIADEALKIRIHKYRILTFWIRKDIKIVHPIAGQLHDKLHATCFKQNIPTLVLTFLNRFACSDVGISNIACLTELCLQSIITSTATDVVLSNSTLWIELLSKVCARVLRD